MSTDGDRSAGRRWGRRFRSVRGRLIVWFSLLFIAVVAAVETVDMVGIPFTPYQGRRGQAREEAFQSLNLIADLKKERLLRWMEERRDDGHVWASSTLMAEHVSRLCAGFRESAGEGAADAVSGSRLRDSASYTTLLETLQGVRAWRGVYEDLHIAEATTGTIILSTDEADVGGDVAGEDYFIALRSGREHYISDIMFDPQHQRPHLNFSHTIADTAGALIAVLILEVSAEDMLVPMLHTGEGLGETGEALLVNRNVEILTSLKHRLADGSEAVPLKHRIQAQPAVRAARGEEGIIETDDYRGEPVLAAYRHVPVDPEWGWGMVVKRDRAELFAPLRRGLVRTAAIGVCGILALVGLTVLVSRTLTRPILSLSRTAARVADGDLAARAEVTTADEVGVLAGTVNAMILRIQTWNQELEAQVRARTAELTALNEDLTREVAERRRAETALRESEHKLRSLFDHMMNGFAYHEMVTDAEGRPVDYVFLEANEAFERMTGLRAAEIVGKRVTEAIPGIEHSEFDWIGTYGRVALTGEPTHFEQYFPPFDKWYSISAYSPAKGYFAVVVQDITERQRFQAAREALIEELEAKNAELERFTYTVSHDLKGPLITIKGFVGMLRKELASGDSERVAEDIERIDRASDQMQRLLDELLELSRVGRVATPPQPCSLTDLAREAVGLLAGQIAERDVQVDIAPDLPVVRGNRPRLLEVMQNLIDNAVKFSRDASRPHVAVGCRRDGDRAVIFVRDNGIGIDARYFENVFGLFNKLRPDSEGTGVGLALVKRIVEVHGGRIWVESEGAGRGCTFCFTLSDEREMPSEKE